METVMPKYLALCKLSTEGLRGLLKEKASARERFLRSLYEKGGAKIHTYDWCASGDYTVAMIVECERDFGVAMTTTALASGALAEIRIIELLSSAEMEQALATPIAYRPPGQG
jgi:uncharacterized protein with GYD domain